MPGSSINSASLKSIELQNSTRGSSRSTASPTSCGVWVPPHLGAMVEFSLATGLRQRNVTHLEWSQVDLARGFAWVHADQSKTAKPLHIPLNATAVRVIRGQIGGHDRYVFHSSGKAPIKYPAQDAWKRALKKVGIEDFTWHDLRHTWASWLRQQGVPTHALQELGGWKSDAMVKRYAHLGPSDMAEYSNVIDAVLDPKKTQAQKKGLRSWRNPFISLAPRRGLEPRTRWLTATCSTS